MQPHHALVINLVVSGFVAIFAWVRTHFLEAEANELRKELETHKGELAKDLKAFETRQATRARGIEWGFAAMREAHGGLVACQRQMTRTSSAVVMLNEVMARGLQADEAKEAVGKAIGEFSDVVVALRARSTTLPPELYGAFDEALAALEGALDGVMRVGGEVKLGLLSGPDVPSRLGGHTRPVEPKVSRFMAEGRAWWTRHLGEAPPPTSMVAAADSHTPTKPIA